MSDSDGSNRNKIIMLGVLLVGVVGYFGYQYAYRPIADENAALQERLESLQNQNRTARVLVEQDGQDAVERRLAGYREELLRVERLIPTSEELPELLDAISVEAQRTGVEVSLIQPTEAVAEDYYTLRTYSMGVLGTYHQIGLFLTRVASLPRIITPANLNLAVVDATRPGSPQLEARFAIETYVLPLNNGGADASDDQ